MIKCKQVLLILLILTVIGCSNESVRRQKIAKLAKKYCSCHLGIVKVSFFFDSSYGQVDCKNGMGAVIKPEDIVKGCD